jgi:hypothetical protein
VTTAILTSERVDVDGLEGFQALAALENWQDGFPLVPPTEERVSAMLRYCDREPGESVGTVAPYYGEATYEKLAIVSVMAGCAPEYYPIVCAAVEAAVQPEFNLYGIQATTSPVTPLVIVGGPLAEEVGLNAADNAFGHGNPANATIGRALRLAMIILGGGTVKPAIDRATHGFPGKYSFCAGEHRAATPWEPFAVRAGHGPEETTVSVFGVHGFHSMVDIVSDDAEGLMATLAAGVAAAGTNNMTHGGEALLVMCPEHAAIVAGSGWTVEDIQHYLFEHARIDMTRLPRGFRDYLKSRRPKWVDQDRYPVVDQPDQHQILVVGGTGIHSVYMPSFGSTSAVTRAIVDVHGTAVASVADLEPAV